MFIRLHSFCWHGTDPQNKTRMIPDADKFTKLRIIPDQLYYNVSTTQVSAGPPEFLTMTLSPFCKYLKCHHTSLLVCRSHMAACMIIKCYCSNISCIQRIDVFSCEIAKFKLVLWKQMAQTRITSAIGTNYIVIWIHSTVTKDTVIFQCILAHITSYTVPLIIPFATFSLHISDIRIRPGMTVLNWYTILCCQWNDMQFSTSSWNDC